MGRKASDYDTMPLCYGCHDAFHHGHGHFAGWDRQRRREWQLERVAETREALGYLPAGESPTRRTS